MPDPLDKSAERAARFYREDPFRADAGNEFRESEADKKAPQRTGGDHLFSAPAGEELPYNPGFVQTQEPRTTTLLILSGGGLVMTVFGITMSYVTGFNYNLPLLPFVALAATLPGAILAHNDVQAIRLGAMNPEGATGAWVARLLGIVGVLSTVGFVVAIFGPDLVRTLFRR